MNQPTLFDADLDAPLSDDTEGTIEGRAYIGLSCTQDGKPARVKDGGPTFAMIEPVDLEQEEAFIPWDDVAWAFEKIGHPEFMRGQP